VSTFLSIIHIIVCSVLVLLILVQQGKGGGMGAALGGGASNQVFGGRGAGNFLTRGTGICAGLFMLTSVSLAYLSSSGDHALRDRQAQEKVKKDIKGQARPKDSGAAATPGSAAPTPATPAPGSAAPAAPAPAPSGAPSP